MRSENTSFVPSGDTSRSRTAPIPWVIDLVTLTSIPAGLAESRTYRSLPVIEVMRSRASMSVFVLGTVGVTGSGAGSLYKRAGNW